MILDLGSQFIRLQQIWTFNNLKISFQTIVSTLISFPTKTSAFLFEKHRSTTGRDQPCHSSWMLTKRYNWADLHLKNIDFCIRNWGKQPKMLYSRYFSTDGYKEKAISLGRYQGSLLKHILPKNILILKIIHNHWT